MSYWATFVGSSTHCGTAAWTVRIDVEEESIVLDAQNSSSGSVESSVLPLTLCFLWRSSWAPLHVYFLERFEYMGRSLIEVHNRYKKRTKGSSSDGL